MLAASSAFQLRTRETTADGASRHIYWPHLREANMEDMRPYAVIMQPQQFAIRRYCGGNPNFYQPDGTLHVGLSDNGKYDDPEDDYLDFANWVGTVADDVACKGGFDDLLNIVSIEFQALPACSDMTKTPAQLRYWECCLAVVWDTTTGSG
jgi:hypothetical protein